MKKKFLTLSFMLFATAFLPSFSETKEELEHKKKELIDLSKEQLQTLKDKYKKMLDEINHEFMMVKDSKIIEKSSSLLKKQGEGRLTPSEHNELNRLMSIISKTNLEEEKEKKMRKFYEDEKKINQKFINDPTYLEYKKNKEKIATIELEIQLKEIEENLPDRLINSEFIETKKILPKKSKRAKSLDYKTSGDEKNSF